MRYQRPLGALAALLVLVVVVGSVSTLLRAVLGLGGIPVGFGRTAAVATVLVVVALVAALAVLGAKNRQWLANPYW